MPSADVTFLRCRLAPMAAESPAPALQRGLGAYSGTIGEETEKPSAPKNK